MALVVMLAVFLNSAPAAADDFTDPDFSTETVATVPPFTLVGLLFAPDGRMFVWEKNGVIRIIKNGVMLPTPFIDLSAKVNTVDDRGFWGFALDPDYQNNHYAYMTYTYEEGGNPSDPSPKTSRLTRVSIDPSNPDIALPATETTILGSIGVPPCSNYPPGSDCIGDEDTSHSIGNLVFAADGTLLVGSGDGAHTNAADPLAMRAQDLNNYNGKILRVNKDGTAPIDNPFYDGTNSIRSKVWIYGVRNPFRFSVQPETGDIWFGDVGWNTWEEINQGVKGGNYGWPCYEGVGVQPAYQSAFPQCGALTASQVKPPFHTYNHSVGTAAIGGPIYDGTAYPQQYRGNFFFADYSGNFIKRVVFDANHQPVSVQPFATNVPAPVSMAVGPDGLIYYLSFTTGEINRIRANGPSAGASATPSYGFSPLQVQFSSDSTVNPGGGSLTYLWNFGDGTTSTLANPVHTYTATGVKVFTASLKVTGASGLNSTATTTVTVGSTPPVPHISMPTDGAHVQPGQTVNYAGSATDPQDGNLPSSALSWTVLLHHNTHIHRFDGGIGSSGSFVVEDHGSVGTFSYEIILTATDSSGLQTSTSVNLPVGTDTTPPSVPTGVAATPGGVGQMGLSWTASTDDVVVSGYRVERCSGVGCSNFAQVGTPTGVSFADSGLLASTSYSYRVAAVDASGNVSGFSAVVSATTLAAPLFPSGLVAGWSFDAGSGSVLADVSGNGNAGSVSGATWAAGKYGGALSFNGTSDLVQVASSASLNLSSGMTLAAWIQPSGAQSGWRTVMQRQVDAWALNASNDGGALVPAGGGTIGGSARWITGSAASPVGVWTHLAVTYDGSILRLYVNGVLATSAAVSGSLQSVTNPLWLGGNVPYGEFFKGLIDEAQVYNRALSVSEIQSVMATPLQSGGGADTQAPSVPAGLSGSAVSSSRVDLTWSASTDNVGVAGYRLERCAGAGCSTFAQVATPSATTHSDTGLAASTSYSYRVRAVDAAGNTSGYSTVFTVSTPAASGGGLPAGLVAAYSFENGAGQTVTDVSGNGNTGTVAGQATWGAGKYGGAFTFDGATRISVASSTSLNLSAGMTLSAWIKPTVAQGGWRTIVQRQTDAWALNASTDGVALVPAGGGTIGGSAHWIVGTAPSPVGSWTHVALTYDGTTLRLYVNGVQVSSATVSGTIQSSSNPLWIGGNQPYGEYFTGLIDELQIYNRALTAAEVQSAMNTPLN
jgi:glucose/arabinose dehydrogenase